jgi:PKD repeat protein
LVESIFGCQDSVQNVVEVNPKPTASFNILNNGSGAPYELAVDNTSKNATNYWWYLGNGDSLNAEEPTYTYSDTGSYNLELVAINSENCKDTIQKNLMVLPFYLDAFLEEVFLTETFDESLQVSLRIANTGNNTIKNVLLTADLNGEFQFSELMNQTIFKGIRAQYQFNSTFKPKEGQKVDFVCVRIQTVNNQDDAVSSNNELCEKGFNKELFLEVYPNPTSGFVLLNYALPERGNVTFNLYDAMGRSVIKGIDQMQEKDLYFVQLNLQSLDSGFYLYSFVFNGTKRFGTIVKR